jgi:hypothetical protein
MKPKELPYDVFQKVLDWTGSKISARHFWEQDGTYFVVVTQGTNVLCLRLFQLGSEWQLSQDNVLYI